MLVRRAGQFPWSRVLTLVLLSACATEIQEPNPDVPQGGTGGGGGGGSSGSATGGSSGSGGSGKSTTGGTGGTGGAGGSAGSAGEEQGGSDAGGSAGSGGSGGSSPGGGGNGGSSGAGGGGGTAGKGGSGGTGGAGGAGGKATGGSGGGGAGGGGAGGGGGKACGTGKLTITSASADGVQDDNPALTAPNAFDGNAGTRWSSAVGAPHWIYFDLGQPAHVSRVQILWEAAYGIDYQIQIASASGGPWTDMLHVTNGNGDTDNLTNLTAADGRYVRMYGNTHNLAYGFSIFEFEIYGDLDETCQ